MTIQYAQEKFHQAINTLATNPGRIQERVIDAWIYGLIHIEPERDLPKEVLEEFLDRKKEITKGSAAEGEGLIASTVNGMSEDEAMEEASWILGYAYNLDNY